MLVDFFLKTARPRLPVSCASCSTCVRALESRVVHGSIEEFHALARLCS
jgi:uncharacterized protein with von Willebrand factor type A (vWA) domain